MLGLDVSQIVDRVMRETRNSNAEIFKAASDAQTGDPEGFMALYEHLKGDDEYEPSDEALACLNAAYQKDHPEAIYKLGLLELMSSDDKYVAEGLELLLRAFNMGCKQAYVDLCNFWNNILKEKEHALDDNPFDDDVSHGECFGLGFFYHNGICLEKNDALAQRYFRLAAKRGNRDAKAYLH